MLFGAVVTAEGGPIRIGSSCVIMENAVIRSGRRHPVSIGNHVLIGPRAYLSGCQIDDHVFLATGATIFNGAQIGERSEVRINGVVHLKTVLPADTTVPIGWVAVGNPAKILPPDAHEEIWNIQKELNFPREVWGLERPAAGQTIMPEITRRYTALLMRHKEDEVIPRSQKG